LLLYFIKIFCHMYKHSTKVTPPRHLIPPLVYPEGRVCSILGLVFPTGFMRLVTVRYLCYLLNHRAYISTGGYTVPEDTCRSAMNINNNGSIPTVASPSIIRCQSVGPIRGTGSDRMVAAPSIVLRDINNVSNTYTIFYNSELWYRNDNSNIQIKKL
jgi:hypothetical protein